MTKEDKIGLAKAAIGTCVEFGVGVIGGVAVAAYTPGNVRGFKKICCALAGVGLCAAAAKAASNATDETIDGIVEICDLAKSMINDNSDDEEVDEE